MRDSALPVSKFGALTPTNTSAPSSTAIVVLGALDNALRLTDRERAGIRIMIAGAGAAGTATARLLLDAGVPLEGIIVCDSRGALRTDAAGGGRLSARLPPR